MKPLSRCRDQRAAFAGSMLLWVLLLLHPSSAWIVSPPRRQLTGVAASTRTPTALFMAKKLWDRLGIEEDDEPLWYIINCVATTELDLLNQCRIVCQDLPDAIKFVVPVERKTRSHGANKMVTETKVNYPGYVFAKLRLCPEVYEKIQNLDLCRSWMGTVNHKGYKKLPPAPLALNEDEVESFGLEVLDESDIKDDDSAELKPDENGIIVDSDEVEEDEPMYKGVDKKALKQYKGLRVEDMVKVIAKGKFFNEDGIIRRLKDGKAFVRFYTYGTMFEEWLNPDDVRKMSGEEILRGLSGPKQPITQRELDGPSVGRYGGFNENDGPPDVRRILSENMRDYRQGGSDFGEQRNRRQDRVADRFRNESYQEQRQGEQNRNRYKDQQQFQRQVGGREIQDGTSRIRPGNDNWAQADVDSQLGRKAERQTRKENRKFEKQYQQDNRTTKAATEGKEDWSAFVSTTSDDTESISRAPQKETAADDFFSSLMSELNKDLGSTPSDAWQGSRQQEQFRSPTGSQVKSSEDDFFASLMSELSNESDEKNRDRKQETSANDVIEVSQDDEFFASLETELGIALGDNTQSSSAEAALDQSFFDDILGSNDADGKTLDVDDSDFKLVPSSEERSTEQPTADAFAKEKNYSFDTDRSLLRSAERRSDSLPLPADAAAALSHSDEFSSSEISATVQDSSPVAVNAGDLTRKTVPDLKEMLRERGLKVSGKKAELVERLLQS